MSGWEGFAKYCGIQGILAMALVGGYITAVFVGVLLPDGYTEIMVFVCGFYFGKNGVPLITSKFSK